MRMLLIDDDPEIRFLAGFVLEHAGHEVVSADSGAAGLAAAVAADFDVVLLDWNLGDMSGTDVLARLVAHDPARPVILVTGRDDPASTRHFLDGGAAGVITKPFDPERLAQRIAEILQGGAAEPPSSP